jgi:hypothetical protein
MGPWGHFYVVLHSYKQSDVGAGAFFALSRFCAREREAKKKSAKARRKKSAKKRKRQARKKKGELALFLPVQ